jgi:DNA-binding beta-propeller fold protein YncE
VSTRNALTRSAALALLALACASGCSGPTSSAASSPPASTGWTARTVLRESAREMAADQVADPRVSAVFALVPGSSAAAAQGPFVVERKGIKDSSVRRGPVVPAGALSLAAGYLWVSEPARSGQAVLVQLDPRTLAVVRTLRVPAAGPAGQPPAGVVPGPGGSVWAAGSRSLLRISPAAGAVLSQAGLPAGLVISGLAADPAGRYLYVSAARAAAGGGVIGAEVLEYSARSGGLLARTARVPVSYSVAGAALTAAPGGVWASIRTGMLGLTFLLRGPGLVAAPLPGVNSSAAPPAGGIFHHAMGAVTVYGGGALWLASGSGVVACLSPQTGQVRARTGLAAMGPSDQLLAADPAAHVVYAVGRAGVIAITPPAGCWG